MANEEQLEIIRQGVKIWNAWRTANPTYKVDLTDVNLRELDLAGVNFGDADLRNCLISGDLTCSNFAKANLMGASLASANLTLSNFEGAYAYGTYFSRAHFLGTILRGANCLNSDFQGAELVGSDLTGVNLRGADFRHANLAGAKLDGISLAGANLARAVLIEASLQGADLRDTRLLGTNFADADLRGADLTQATLVRTDLRGANLTGCRIYGLSAWDIKLERATQQNLVITPDGEPEITVDNIEVAQFIYLMLHNEKIRDVIDTITSKAVLILGRFTAERKAVLDALRDELRKRDYLPILFDFDKPTGKDLTGTVTTLANMVRFIVADGTDPKSIPHELATIVPTTIVPVKPILLASEREYAMFGDLQRRHHWVLPTHRYERQEQLIADLDLCVIQPAAEKAEELRNTVFI